MNNLFSSGKEKILSYFYALRGEECYFSQILKSTRLTPNTVLQHLSSLENQGIVHSRKTSAHTFFKVNASSPFIPSLFSYFDHERFLALPSVYRRAIQKYISGLSVKPLIVVVFGSLAKGSFTEESDVDILLVYNTKEQRSLRLRDDIQATTGVHVQPLVVDYSFFEEQVLTGRDKVVSHAIATCFVLYGAEYFYPLVLK